MWLITKLAQYYQCDIPHQEPTDICHQSLENKFHYDLSRKIKDIKSNYVFNSRASYSVPPAIIAFLDSTDYESAIRNAISLGGDADTEACIAGGIAEAFYRETPTHIVDFCDRKIDSTLKNVAFDFKKHFCK